METMTQPPRGANQFVRLARVLVFLLMAFALLLPGMVLAQPSFVEVCMEVLDNGDANPNEGGDFDFLVSNQSSDIGNGTVTIERFENQPVECAGPFTIPDGSTELSVVQSAALPWPRNALGFPQWEITDGNTTFGGSGQVAEVSDANLASLSGTVTVTFTSASGRQVTEVCKEVVENTGDGVQTDLADVTISINTATQISTLIPFVAEGGGRVCQSPPLAVNLPLGATTLNTSELFTLPTGFNLTPGFPEIVIEEIGGSGNRVTNTGSLGGATDTTISSLSGDLRVIYRNRLEPIPLTQTRVSVCKRVNPSTYDSLNPIDHSGAFQIFMSGGFVNIGSTTIALSAVEGDAEVCRDDFFVDEPRGITTFIEDFFPPTWESNEVGYPRWEVLDANNIPLLPETEGTAFFQIDWNNAAVRDEDVVKIRVVNQAGPFSTDPNPGAQSLMRVCNELEDNNVDPLQALNIPISIFANFLNGFSGTLNYTEDGPAQCIGSFPLLRQLDGGNFSIVQAGIDQVSWDDGRPLARLYNQPLPFSQQNPDLFAAERLLGFREDRSYGSAFFGAEWLDNRDYTLLIRNRIQPVPLRYELCLRVDDNGINGNTEGAFIRTGLGLPSFVSATFSTPEGQTDCFPAAGELPPLPNINNPWFGDLRADFTMPAGPFWPGLDYLPQYGARTGFSELSINGQLVSGETEQGSPRINQGDLQAALLALNATPGSVVRQTFVIRPAANLEVCAQVLPNGDAFSDDTDVVLSSFHPFGLVTQGNPIVTEGGDLQCVLTRDNTATLRAPFSLIGDTHSASQRLPEPWVNNPPGISGGFPIWQFTSTGGPQPFFEEGSGEDTTALNTRRTAAESGNMRITFFNRRGPLQFMQLCKEVQGNGDLLDNQGGSFGLGLSFFDINNNLLEQVDTNLDTREDQGRICSQAIEVPGLSTEFSVIETEPLLSADWPGSAAGSPQWFVEDGVGGFFVQGTGLDTGRVALSDIASPNFEIVFRNQARFNEPPTVVKSFAPDNIPAFGVSQLTLTLSNNNPIPATLLADLVDTFDQQAMGVVIANPPNAATSCGAAVTAIPGSNSVTLAAGAVIPVGTPGTCTVTVDVTSALPGVYTNTIEVGQLQTDRGPNVVPTSADLTVRAPGAISVEKVEIGGPAAADWAFTISTATSGCDIGGQTAWPLTIAAGGGTQSQPALPVFSRDNVTPCEYSIAETVQAGWDVTALQCDNGTPNPGQARVDGVRLQEGGTISCAFENTRQTGGLQVTKVVNGDLAGATDWTFTLGVDDPVGCDISGLTNPLTIAVGGGSNLFANLPAVNVNTGNPCVYQVTETEQTGWTVQEANPQIGITLTPGSTTGITFTNTRVTNEPTVVKSFVPNTIPTYGISRLKLALTNNNPIPATLTADLIDTLPAGMVIANPANAITDCPSGVVGAISGADVVSLGAGAQIPGGFPTPGSCVVSLDVSSATAGTYTNEIPAFALQTDRGPNVVPTSADLTVRAPGAISVEKVEIGGPAAADWAFTISTATSGCDIGGQTAWPLTIAAGGGTQSQPALPVFSRDNVTPCEYSIAETVQAGWDVTALQCDNGTPNPGQARVDGVRLQEGGTISCAFENTRQTGGLQVTKVVNGDLAGATDWTFTLGVDDPVGCDISGLTNPLTIAVGGGSNLFANLPAVNVNTGNPCVYQVTETEQTGWTVQEANPQIGITLTPGSTTGITFTNTRVTNEPTVIKSFVPNTIPTYGISRLTLALTNNNPNPATLAIDLVDNLPAGVVIANPANAVTDCPSGVVGATPGADVVSLGAGAQIPGGFPTPGSCVVSLDVTSAAAGVYTNTIPINALQTDLGNNEFETSAELTMRGPGAIAIEKVTIGGAAAADWAFNINTATSGCDLNGQTDWPLTIAAAGGTQSQPALPVFSRDDNTTPCEYSITETVQAIWDVTALECTGSSGAVGTPDLGNALISNVQLQEGGTISCAFENTRQTAGLQVTKVVTGDAANATDWVFTLDVNDPNGCDISGITNPLTIAAAGGTGSFADLPAVNLDDDSDCVYQVTEAEQAGWVVQEANPQTDIAITPGSNTEITFTNIEQGGVTVTANVTGATEGYAPGSEFDILLDCDNDAFDRNLLLVDGATEGPFDIDTGTACTVTEQGLPDPVDSGETFVGYAWDTPVITPADFTVTGGESIAVTVDNLLNRSQIAVADPAVVGCAADFAAVTFTITVFNGGTDTLNGLQLVNDLESTFAASPTGYSLDSVESDDLSVNPAFDGNADTNMLIGTDALAPGESASIEVSVIVLAGPTLAGTDFVNQVIASGTGDVTQLEVSDLSHFEFNPDPSLDGPTTFQINCDVLAVPAMNRWGLLLMALLLMIVGIVVQELRRKPPMR